MTTECDFTGHGYICAHFSADDCRKHRCSHRNTRRRSVFRNCTFRNMYVNIIFLEKFRRNIIIGCYRTDVRNACLSRFFHDISELSGKYKFSLARHDIDLDLKCITSDLCPCKSSGDSDFVFLICHQITVSGFAEKIFKVFAFDCDLLLVIFHNFTCCFTTDLTDLTLQSTHTGLTGVECNDLAKCGWLNRQCSFRNTIYFQLFRNQMLFRNVFFFIFGITGNFNDFHTVKKRSRNTVHIICGRNK